MSMIVPVRMIVSMAMTMRMLVSVIVRMSMPVAMTMTTVVVAMRSKDTCYSIQNVISCVAAMA